MLQFQKRVVNGRLVLLPVNPSPARNFLGEAQEAPAYMEVPLDPNGGMTVTRRWIPPSRRLTDTRWRGIRPMPPIRVKPGEVDHPSGWTPGDPPILVDHAPPPVGYHYDDKWQLVKDAPEVVATGGGKDVAAPVTSPGGFSGFIDSLVAWVKAHPFVTAGGAVAIWFVFLRGRGSKLF